MTDAKWLDSPDGDGWWHWSDGKDGFWDVVLVKATMAYWIGPYSFENYAKPLAKLDGGKWYRVIDPPPPPKPLPKSREVTLTARVYQSKPNNNWNIIVKVGDVVAESYGGTSHTRESLLSYVRNHYGIEPEVVE